MSCAAFLRGMRTRICSLHCFFLQAVFLFALDITATPQFPPPLYRSQQLLSMYSYFKGKGKRGSCIAPRREHTSKALRYGTFSNIHSFVIFTVRETIRI